jgi:hypothetical protein
LRSSLSNPSQLPNSLAPWPLPSWQSSFIIYSLQ